MPYYMFAWISSFSFGLSTVIAKLTSKHEIKNIWLFNFLWSFAVLLFTIPLALRQGVGWPHSWENISLAAIVHVVWLICYVFALYKLDVSTLSPLLNFRAVFGVFFASILLHESFSSQQFLLVAAILFAGPFVSIDEKFTLRSFFQWPVVIALLATVALALRGIFVNRALSENTVWEVTLWMAVLAQVMLLATVPLFIQEVRKTSLKQVGAIGAISFAGMIGYLTENKALERNVGISTIIIALPLSMIMVYLMSVVAPRLLEKHTLRVYIVRGVAAAVMVSAAIALSRI